MNERDEIRVRRAPGETYEWPADAPTYFAVLKDDGLALYVGSDLVFHFDAEGRFRRAFAHGAQVLRGLDGKLVRRTRPERVRVDAGADAAPTDAAATEALARLSAAAAHEALAAEPAAGPRPSGPADEAVGPVLELLERAAAFDAQRDLERFRAAYAPLGVLPPDCYRSVILQATSGCAWNHCEFCTLYASTAYRQKTPAEFRAHIARVREFFGRALLHRRGVFLGEANALEIPQADLLTMLDAVQALLPEVLSEVGARVSAFSDVFHDRERAVEELRELRERGLGRVYLGVESGDDGVLRRLHKPATRRAVTVKVERLKEAGVPVGVIFLVGAGGRELAAAHVEATIELTGALPLDAGDIVYLSPLVGRLARAAASTDALDASELEAQEDTLARALREQGRRVGRYDIERFVYY